MASTSILSDASAMWAACALHTKLNAEDATTESECAPIILAAQARVENLLGYAIATTYPTSFPDDILLAVCMTFAHFYENREATIVGVTAQELPLGVMDIIDGYRTWSF